jgi:flagella basal body P-ring formation protein FlgA
MNRMLRTAVLLLLAAFASGAVAAADTQRLRTVQYQQVAAESYVALARRALEESVSGSSTDVQVEPTGSYRDLRLPAGRLELRIRTPRGASRSRAMIWVDAFVDGRLRVSRPVGFIVHKWERVLVARERLAAKTALDERQFELRTTDVAGVEGSAVNDVGLLAGKRLRRELRPGAVLSLNDLQNQPLVRSGASISIYARVGRVLIKSAAIAERDAFAGDVIDARVPGTRETLRVRVTANNTAWISENENTSVF